MEILEYDTQGKALLVKCVTHTKKLNYEDDDDEDDSLNIDDSFDDDLESTDFSLTEIQNETTSAPVLDPTLAPVLALAPAPAPSPASSTNKFSLEVDATTESAATLDQSIAQQNRRYCIEGQTSSSSAGYSVSAFDGKELSTPSSALSSAVVISDQPTLKVSHSSGRCGDTPNVVESCLVADGRKLPTSKSCPGNGHDFSPTKLMMSCPESSFGSLSSPDSCAEIFHDSSLRYKSSLGNCQDLNDHSSTCKSSPALNHNLSDPTSPANPISSVLNCPSTDVFSRVQSSTCNASSSTCLDQTSTVQLAKAQQNQPDHTVDAQALLASGASSDLRRPESSAKEAAIDRQTSTGSSPTARPPSLPENATVHGTGVS